MFRTRRKRRPTSSRKRYQRSQADRLPVLSLLISRRLELSTAVDDSQVSGVSDESVRHVGQAYAFSLRFRRLSLFAPAAICFKIAAARRATQRRPDLENQRKNMSEPMEARVLLVEDEVLVRMFAVDALEDGGFKVDQAGNAADALTLLRARLSEITAVVIDLGLPDRQGDEVAAEIRRLRT